MSYQGHCNCGSISLSLKSSQQPSGSLTCYCRNCKRSGGAYSVNYAVEEGEVDIQDPQSSLKTYNDKNTLSGNEVKRRFCSNCGSAIATLSPKFPGKVLIKASLFDDMAGPVAEVFTSRRETWQPAIQGAQQS